MVASHVSPTGDLACNPGVCPDQELNRQPFGSQATTQSTEPQKPGLVFLFIQLEKFWKLIFSFSSEEISLVFLIGQVG